MFSDYQHFLYMYKVKGPCISSCLGLISEGWLRLICICRWNEHL